MALSLKHRSLRWLLKTFESSLRLFSDDVYFKVTSNLIANLNPVYEVNTTGGIIKFLCDSDITYIRAGRALSKEEDTIEWIESFNQKDVFWDIGSNMGVYSLYAAIVSQTQVVAIDPLPANYSILSRNLTLNKLHDKVMVFCLALSDVTKVAELQVPVEADTTGGAGGVFGETRDNYGNQVEAVYRQHALGYSLDDFLQVFSLPFPNHIKIDVDGIQDSLITGARETLCDPRLKSAMIELQPKNEPRNIQSYDFIMNEMNSAGFEHVACKPSVTGYPADINVYPTNNYFIKP
jgi:FkbM family methyltransferase